MRAAGSAAVSGSPTEITSLEPDGRADQPDRRRERPTGSLLLKGLTPEEAANLTAFLCGIHVGTQHWKLHEVNRLLFLRELHQTGRFGSEDGSPAH